MTSEVILKDIMQLLKPLLKPEQIATPQTELVADLGLDSVQVMDFLSVVEEHFDISIPLNILPDIRTVADLAAQVQHLIAHRS